jgi:hypothetical protein
MSAVGSFYDVLQLENGSLGGGGRCHRPRGPGRLLMALTVTLLRAEARRMESPSGCCRRSTGS